MATKSLTTDQLIAIEKAMQGIVDDPDKAADIKETFGEFRKALGEGTRVTADDIDLAMDVLLEKGADPDAGGGYSDLPEDPMAPIFDGLYRQLAPIAKKGGLSDRTLQELFHKAYGESLGELDAVIAATTEAVAVELGAGDQVDFGKAKGKQAEDKTGHSDEGGEEEDEDMEKILKKLGIPTTIAKRIGSLQAEVAALTHDKAIGIFQKRATAAGEPGMASDLLAIHEVDPELCARIEKVLKTKNAVLQKNANWAREIGDGDGAPAEGASGPLNQLEGIAREMIAKGLKVNGRTASFAKAFSLACEQNPELYTEYDRQKHREIARGGA